MIYYRTASDHMYIFVLGIRVHASFYCFCGSTWSSRHAWYLISLKKCSLLKVWRQACQTCSGWLRPVASKKKLAEAIEYAVER